MTEESPIAYLDVAMGFRDILGLVCIIVELIFLNSRKFSLAQTEPTVGHVVFRTPLPLCKETNHILNQHPGKLLFSLATRACFVRGPQKMVVSVWFPIKHQPKEGKKCRASTKLKRFAPSQGFKMVSGLFALVAPTKSRRGKVTGPKVGSFWVQLSFHLLELPGRNKAIFPAVKSLPIKTRTKKHLTSRVE